MRILRVVLIVVLSSLGTAVFLTPASATPPFVLIYSGTGDQAFWYPDTNILKVCDYSDGNGTAGTTLDVIGGGAWQIYDANGARSGCGTAGPLNVDETKQGRLYLYPSNYCSCTPATRPVSL